MTKFGASQAVLRVEDKRFITGQGRYTDDITLPGQTYGYVLRSPHAHAVISRIDTAAAKLAPGVLGVYTVDDLKADDIGLLPCLVGLKSSDGAKRADTPRPALADGKVRYVGDPVAFVVASSLNAARDSAELIDVDYTILDAVAEMPAAAAAGAPLIWDHAPGNRCFDWSTGDKAKADAHFAAAHHVTKLELVNNRIVVASMEMRSALAAYDAQSERFTLHTPTQGSFFLKDVLAKSVFKVPRERFLILTPDVGGGFGMKIFLYPEHVLTLYASRKLGRPVKWASDRSEAFLSDIQGRDNRTTGELALDRDGTILAMRVHSQANMGAYLSNFAPAIPTLAGSRVLASQYRFQAIYCRVEGMFTNTVPVDAYRGAGRPEANYLVERLIDKAALELKLAPDELRRRNFVPQSAMPWKSAMGETYDSGDFVNTLAQAMQAADWKGFETRRQAARAQGKRRGIGIGCYLEATMGGVGERAEIRFAADGMVDVLVGTQSTGQGHETAYTQIIADRLGVPQDRVRVIQGDSDAIPTGGGTGGARSLYSEGGAIISAAAQVVDKGKEAAGRILEAAVQDIEFEAGRFRIAGTDRAIGILDLASQLRGAGAGAELLDTAASLETTTSTFPNGCHIA